MTKAKNIFIIFALNYLVIVFVSAFLELNSLNSKAREVMETIQLAGDMALEQSQAIDSYLTTAGHGGYKIKTASRNGAGYVEQDIYSAMLGIDTSTATGKASVFDRLYNNTDFYTLAGKAGVMKTPIKYFTSASNYNFSWYYLPTVSVVGTDILPTNIIVNKLRVQTSSGGNTTTSWSETIRKAYGVDKIKKKSDGEDYYNTPLAYGVTYINKELVRRLFVNNMDVIMRNKYAVHGQNLNTADGGTGILKGATYAQSIDSTESFLVENSANTINNGVFSFNRGRAVNTGTNTVAYEGIEPRIDYKVIDMYDIKNDRLLKYLFGFNTNGYATKAEYLKSLDSALVNPVTNRPYTQKPFVVAKVTFYADVYIPYFYITMREFASDLPTYNNNFIDLKVAGTNSNGSMRVQYTRFFAVTP